MKLFRILPAFLAAAVFAAGCDTASIPTEPTQTTESSVSKFSVSDGSQIIPGRYIVVLKNGISSEKAGQIRAGLMRSANVDRVYSHGFQGFAGQFTQQDVTRLAGDPNVALIEPDRRISLAIMGKPAKTVAERIPWGITKVGGSGNGAGLVAWIIDTGIDLDHPDLNVDLNRSRNFCSTVNTPDDGHGHGTHVAGTIAAIDNTIGVIGVAQGASVVAVRVLNSQGSGSYSDIIAGVDYVAANGSAGDVANMSLGGPASSALDLAVTSLAATGVRVVVAAGNSGIDASGTSPARVNATNFYTISAISSTNCLTSWSNYGLMVDYAAPGASILSLWKNGGTATLSGTSMAAPHVAGILLLGPVNPSGSACSDRDGVPDPIAHR